MDGLLGMEEEEVLIEPPLSDDEGAAQASPLSTIQLIRQEFPWIHTPPPSSPPPLTPSPTLPPPPLLFNMENFVKLLVFKGIGNEDLD